MSEAVKGPWPRRIGRPGEDEPPPDGPVGPAARAAPFAPASQSHLPSPQRCPGARIALRGLETHSAERCHIFGDKDTDCG
jgi:hypothetical protein